MNVNNLIIDSYNKYSNKNFIYEKTNNKYKPITYNKFITKLTHVAKKLIDLNLSNKNILIYSKNSINYMIIDLAIISYVGTTININEQTKIEELNPIIKELINNHVFEMIIFLDKKIKGEIKESYILDKKQLKSGKINLL